MCIHIVEVMPDDWMCLLTRLYHRKTTLLKCLAHLNVYEGEILYRGQ